MGDCLATIDMGRKVAGSWVAIQHSVAWAEVYLPTKWHLDPSSRLTTIDIGQKVGVLLYPYFRGRELGPHLPLCRLPPYQVAS